MMMALSGVTWGGAQVLGRAVYRCKME